MDDVFAGHDTTERDIRAWSPSLWYRWAVVVQGMISRGHAGEKRSPSNVQNVPISASHKHDSALAALSEALALAQETGERWWEAEIHRLRSDELQRFSKDGVSRRLRR